MRKSGFSMVVGCVAVALCVTSLAGAQASAAPPKGEAVLASVQVTATVAKINQKTREVTLKADDGQEYTFVAGDEVKNLAQVKKGDIVVATYTEALAYEVKKSWQGRRYSGRCRRGRRAWREASGRPRGGGDRDGRDHRDRHARSRRSPSRRPDGTTRTIKVKNPANLQGVSVGDTVDITYVEAIAIKVEKAAKK